MAIKITKKEVKLIQDKLYLIVLNLEYTVDEKIVLSRDYTQKYRTGDNITAIINKLKTSMQKDIDSYKAEQTIFNATALDTAINTLQNSIIP